MTAKAAAGFTLRTHKGIERGGGLLPALGAALLLAGIAGQVCSAMGMPVDGLLLLAGMAAAVCAAALTGRRDRLALLPLGVLLAAAVFCIVFHTAVGNSLLGLVNRYLAQRQSREAVVYVPYACNEVSAMWAGIPISVAVGTALGVLAVTALADAETQPALLLSASQTLVERYNTFTVDVFLTGTPGADILPAAETHIDCDNASVEATSAGTAANSKTTADGTAVTLSYYGEESAVFDESGRFLLGTITLKAGRSGIATVTASRSVGTVDGLTDVDIPAASGFSGVCSVTIYHYSSFAAEEPVGSPKTGDMGALAYCAMCAASGAGTAALWLRRRGKRG